MAKFIIVLKSIVMGKIEVFLPSNRSIDSAHN
jgi:hypothetical protein